MYTTKKVNTISEIIFYNWKCAECSKKLQKLIMRNKTFVNSWKQDQIQAEKTDYVILLEAGFEKIQPA